MGTFLDGLANLISRLGTSADRNTQSYYAVPVVSQQQCEAAYRSSWLARKVHDLPPFEMTRAARDWQAESDEIEGLENHEARHGLWAKLRTALTVARLHGGAAIVMGVRVGGSADPSLPLDVSRVGRDGLRYLIVASRYQLSAPRGFDYDPESDFYGQPVEWEMHMGRGQTIRLHPSRVVCFHGSPLPPGMVTASPLDSFWGDPLSVSIKSAVDNAETAQAAVATLLHEIKNDIVSIPGLTEMLSDSETEKKLGDRMAAMALFKSMFNTVYLDGGDGKEGGESIDTRQVSFQQHPELLRQFISVVAAAADIPATRLMGEAAGGLQSTGKGEQNDFERMISARQSAELKPALARIDEVLIRSALGARPPTVYYEFAPLAPVDQKAAAEIEKAEAETIQIYQNTNLIPADALAKATQTRMVESGRFPGLEKALEEASQEAQAVTEGDNPPDPQAAAQAVDRMQARGAITTDQATVLLTDAAPRTLYVQRKLLNAADLIEWAKAQGFGDTLPAGEIHVTVAHSRTPIDWLKVGTDWHGDENGKLVVPPGGARIVEPLGDKGAVVLLFNASALAYRHEAIREAGASWDYPEYQPHVTITYQRPEGLDLSQVQPYRGKLEFGPEIFEEVDDGYADRFRS